MFGRLLAQRQVADVSAFGECSGNSIGEAANSIGTEQTLSRLWFRHPRVPRSGG